MLNTKRPLPSKYSDGAVVPFAERNDRGMLPDSPSYFIQNENVFFPPAVVLIGRLLTAPCPPVTEAARASLAGPGAPSA